MTVALLKCACCGGTRRIYFATDAGMRWRPCHGCGGVGETMRLVGG